MNTKSKNRKPKKQIDKQPFKGQVTVYEILKQFEERDNLLDVRK